MVVQTWGFVKTRPNYPWTKVELRAEPGAVFRVSGATYSDALAEGHACWREAHEVMASDVEEAYDVMWMTRPGWRQG